MERYFSLKSTLVDSLSSLKWQIIFDIKNEGINPINVELIGEMISDIGEVLSYIDWPLKDFSQLRNDTGPGVMEFFNGDGIEVNRAEIFDKVIFTEKNAIITFVEEFYILLQTWLQNHKNELNKQIDSLAQSPNEAIILATNRLKAYVDSLKNESSF